jgi:hypothetical protein
MKHTWAWFFTGAACLHTLAAAEPLRLGSLHHATNSDGALRMVTRDDAAARKWSAGPAAFRAVTSATWPEGLVPVFAVEHDDGRWELRRLPPRGTENYTEPLFFALPGEDEPEAAQITGTWNCAATNAIGTKHFLAFELAAERGRIAGRFDQNAEYRVAYIGGGTFASNRFHLLVEYSNDRYTLDGEWRNGALAGKFHQHEGSDRGSWSAERPPRPELPTAGVLLPLHEWRRDGGDARSYSTGTNAPGPGWVRAPRPLCRVWELP